GVDGVDGPAEGVGQQVMYQDAADAAGRGAGADDGHGLRAEERVERVTYCGHACPPGGCERAPGDSLLRLLRAATPGGDPVPLCGAPGRMFPVAPSQGSAPMPTPTLSPPDAEPLPEPARQRKSWVVKFRAAFRGMKWGVRGHSSFFVHFFFAALVLVAAI